MSNIGAAKFMLRVYSPAGVFRRIYDASLILAVPTIVRQVNTPASDITISLALPYDGFGYGQANGVNLFDLVKVYVISDFNPQGYLVYQGHVEEITAQTDQTGVDHVDLRLFPIDAEFGRSLWKAAGSYVLNYSNADASTIMAAALADVNAIYGTEFTANMAPPGLSLTATYTRETHQDVIDTVAKNLLSTWYWRIRPDGTFDLQQYSDASPIHRLTMGVNVDSIQITASLLNTKNKIVVTWGGTPTDSEYPNAPSIAAYGQRMEDVSDSSITTQAGADLRGAGELAANPVIIKTVLVVNSKYASETIQPGDTVRVLNMSANANLMLSGVQRVAHISYDGSLCELQLTEVVNNFGQEITKLIG
jgi:hypothetical protein